MSFIDKFVSLILPAPAALFLAKRLNKSAGIGHGGIVTKSGELDCMAKALAMRGSGPAPVLFDVGANIGEWTVAVKEKWAQAKVHAFEPSAVHIALATKAIAGISDVTLNPLALGRQAGKATLYKDQDITGLASMTKRELDHVGIAMGMEEQIQVSTLDDYCAAHAIAAIDYLKIDVEGHELDVLLGGSGMLERGAIGAVQFEFGGCNIDTRTYLRDFWLLFQKHGYRLFICGHFGRLIEITRYRESLEQFVTTNYVAVRK